MAVFNQPPPLVDYNLFSSDIALAEALRRESGPSAESAAIRLGQQLGTEEVIHWGFLANEYPPVLHTHDRFGERIDEVEFHPAWHNLMRLSVEAIPHAPSPARAALFYLASQNEQGHTCPISMTHAALPVLRRDPALAAEWEPGIASRVYDPRFRPAPVKQGVLIGMAMTEKQGGSDVRANTTTAEPVEGGYHINGHKWFCSAPMSDAFLVLAQAPGGLTCFLLPRWTPGRRRNGFHLQRLKSKLGNRSNASSEVEFHDAWATRIGDEGRGIPTIIDMVQHTRLDCVIGSAALMRQALVQAIHHARHRSAFGRPLIHQPLMRNVLADLALESEAATLLMMRLARAMDEDPAFARLTAAVAKYWICKRAPVVVAEALECLGGNGYIEECVMPRLYREAPLNGIWEGSANVICLDVLRAIRREPESLERVLAEIRHVDPRLPGPIDESNARRLTEQLAIALQASLLIRHSPSYVAGAFCTTRLAGDWGRSLGTLPASVDVSSILDRSWR